MNNNMMDTANEMLNNYRDAYQSGAMKYEAALERGKGVIGFLKMSGIIDTRSMMTLNQSYMDALGKCDGETYRIGVHF